MDGSRRVGGLRQERRGRAAPDAALGSLRILVVEDNVDTNSGLSFAPVVAPASVWVELPGGAQMTIVTDHDGRATITDIDWSLGRASAIASASGHTTEGAIELAPETFAQFPHEEDADVVFALAGSSSPSYQLVGQVTRETARSPDRSTSRSRSSPVRPAVDGRRSRRRRSRAIRNRSITAYEDYIPSLHVFARMGASPLFTVVGH